MQIEEGKYYRTTDGQVWGPAPAKSRHGDFALAPVDGGWSETFSEGGYCITVGPRLVCEVARLGSLHPWRDVNSPLDRPYHPAALPCSSGHAWVDNGCKRTWCRDCDTYGYYNVDQGTYVKDERV